MLTGTSICKGKKATRLLRFICKLPCFVWLSVSKNPTATCQISYETCIQIYNYRQCSNTSTVPTLSHQHIDMICHIINVMEFHEKMHGKRNKINYNPVINPIRFCQFDHIVIRICVVTGDHNKFMNIDNVKQLKLVMVTEYVFNV